MAIVRRLATIVIDGRRAMSRTRKDCAPKYETAPRWNDYWQWWKSEPKWWRKMYKHRPRRRELRHALHEAVNGDVDAVVWPQDVKPWLWFY